MTQVNFRIDDEVKESAERALKAMGLNMSTAITMFLTKVGREQRIPFDVAVDPFYSESNMRHLGKIIDDIESGRAKLTEHDLIEVDDEDDEDDFQ